MIGHCFHHPSRRSGTVSSVRARTRSVPRGFGCVSGVAGSPPCRPSLWKGVTRDESGFSAEVFRDVLVTLEGYSPVAHNISCIGR